jgi:hypothetical protein
VADEPLVAWIEGMARAMGHGGKKKIAERLEVAQDVISQLLKRRSGFDRKTVNLMMWMISSKAEDYLDFPILETVQIDQLILERRELGDTEEWTWRKAE